MISQIKEIKDMKDFVDEFEKYDVFSKIDQSYNLSKYIMDELVKNNEFKDLKQAQELDDCLNVRDELDKKIEAIANYCISTYWLQTVLAHWLVIPKFERINEVIKEKNRKSKNKAIKDLSDDIETAYKNILKIQSKAERAIKTIKKL